MRLSNLDVYTSHNHKQQRRVSTDNCVRPAAMERQPGRVMEAAAAAAEEQQSREGRDLPGPSREGRDPPAGQQETSQGMEPELSELPSPPQQEADVDLREAVPQRSSSAPSLRSQEGALLPPLDSLPPGGAALSRRSSLVTVSSMSNYTQSSDQMETSNEQTFSSEDAFVGASSSQSPMESGAELEGLPASAAQSVALEKAGTSGLERGIPPDEASSEEQEEPPRKKFASLAHFLQQGDGASTSSQQQEGEGGHPLPDGSRKRQFDYPVRILVLDTILHFGSDELGLLHRAHAEESLLQDAVKKRLLQTGRPLLGRQLSTPESCCSPASEGQEGTDDDASWRDVSVQEESSGDTRDVRGRLKALKLASPAPQPSDAQADPAAPGVGGGDDAGPATSGPPQDDSMEDSSPAIAEGHSSQDVAPDLESYQEVSEIEEEEAPVSPFSDQEAARAECVGVPSGSGTAVSGTAFGEMSPGRGMPAEPPKEQQESSEHPVWQEPGQGTSQGQEVGPAACTLEPPTPLGEQQAGGRAGAALAEDSDQRVPEVDVPLGQDSPGAERNPAAKRKSTDSPHELTPTKRGPDNRVRPAAMEGQQSRVMEAAAAAAEQQQPREGRDLPGPSREGTDPAAVTQEEAQMVTEAGPAASATDSDDTTTTPPSSLIPPEERGTSSAGRDMPELEFTAVRGG
ncbi:neurofilament heavy polypeptide-like [Schistocerca serialis cubense]|uniref:neurofilament heavy polypeptide-like n=1 Tax=Schistocerca serialis cubense TaxID=2023355 RepID=UPI00214F27C5|nr:neurofilament heavy polypeptide-like [Schistocerca serialis cubense]